ncbi:MAG: hypothetical protein KDA21_02730, partial [Phycisphaerales bacterium]|nr:hypothetical protein [Phycisphaerales bacterium]
MSDDALPADPPPSGLKPEDQHRKGFGLQPWAKVALPVCVAVWLTMLLIASVSLEGLMLPWGPWGAYFWGFLLAAATVLVFRAARSRRSANVVLVSGCALQVLAHGVLLVSVMIGLKREAWVREHLETISELNRTHADDLERSLESLDGAMLDEVHDLDQRIAVVGGLIASTTGEDRSVYEALEVVLTEQRRAYVDFALAWDAFTDAGGLGAAMATRDEVESLRDQCDAMIRTTEALRAVEQRLPEILFTEMEARDVGRERRQTEVAAFRAGSFPHLRAQLRDADIEIATQAGRICAELARLWGRWEIEADTGLWL